MRKSNCLLILASLLLVLLAACNLATDITQEPPDDDDMQPLEITLEPTARPTPYCPDISSFGKLDEYWPGGFTFPSDWKFTWFYTLGTTKDSPFDWNWTCVPDSYSIFLSTGPDFEDEIEVQVSTPHVILDITKVSLDWYFNSQLLEPLKVYRWVAVGHYGDIDIGMDRVAQLHQDSRWIGQNPMNKGSFRTGPQCGSGSIDVPVLAFPADNETIDIRQPIFSWDVTSCMPLVFITQLSRNPDLQSLAPGLNSFAAADYSFYLQTNYPWLDMQTISYGGIPALPDCTTLYWRVLGGIGDATYTEREWGEWSEVQSFYVNSGSCPTPTPVPYIPPPASPLNCAELNAEQCAAAPGCEWIQVSREGSYACQAVP
jgi:hypothetical protein